MSEFSIQDVLAEAEMEMGDKMEKLRRDLTSLRTGRANPQLLDNVQVEYYGSRVPLKQVAAVSVPEPRTLEVRPWTPARWTRSSPSSARWISAPPLPATEASSASISPR